METLALASRSSTERQGDQRVASCAMCLLVLGLARLGRSGPSGAVPPRIAAAPARRSRELPAVSLGIADAIPSMAGRRHCQAGKEISMRSLDPWTQIAELRQEMDSLFDRVFASRWEFPASGDWVPSLELSETEDALVLKMDVAGMNATLNNGLLVMTLPKTPAAKGFSIPVKPE
jgi:hypothetical protein